MMNRTSPGLDGSDRQADAAFVLYLIPFAINAVYALALWVQSGVGSSILPQLVYLEVAQSPYVFLVGFAAVIAGAVLDLTGESPGRTSDALLNLSKRLQVIAIISVVLAALSAWYAAGFDPAGGFFNLLDARYPLIFGALLILFSFLILPSIHLERSSFQRISVIVLLLVAPVAVYEIGKRNAPVGLAVGLALIIIAALLVTIRGKSDVE